MKLYNKPSFISLLSIMCLLSGAVAATATPTYAANPSNIDMEVNITPSIIMTIPTDTVTLNLAPTSTASFNSTNLSVTVGTNNPTGYTLTMAPSDTTSTSLTRTGGTETIPTLATLAGGYTEQTFTTNRWGYKLSSGNYLPFATSNEINVTDGPSNASTNTVTFAAKADMSQTSGAYTLEITFTAVANYVPTLPDPPTSCNTPVPGNYTYLQDITSSNKASVLSSLSTGTAYYLRDSRDEEPYCIAKLADGNLWFLDNLRLDLVAHKNDLNQTNTNATNEQLAYLKGTSTSTSSDKWAMSGVSYWTSSYSYSAPQIAIKNASNENWNPDTVASVTYGDGSGKIGVYYNYCAASAGTYCWGNGTSYTGSPSGDPKTDTGYDIDGDICPAGWRMPTGGAIATGTIAKGEYQSLANAITGGTSSSLSGDNATTFMSALSTPFSGYFYGGSADGQDNRGRFWSSTWYDSNDMYLLGIDSSNVLLQNVNNRSYGYSVRCTLQ